MRGVLSGLLGGGDRRRRAHSLAMLGGVAGAVLLVVATTVLVAWTYQGRSTGPALAAVVVAAGCWTAFVLEAGAVVEYAFGGDDG